jgi:hypothetical protein
MIENHKRIEDATPLIPEICFQTVAEEFGMGREIADKLESPVCELAQAHFQTDRIFRFRVGGRDTGREELYRFLREVLRVMRRGP